MKYDEARYNADAIGPILSKRFIESGLPVKLKNPGLVFHAFEGLRLLGCRKPLFTSKERFIVLTVLSHPQIFSTMSSQIELLASIAGQQFCWCGTGRFKQHDFMEQLRTLMDVDLLQDAFMEIHIDQCFPALKDLLEWPAGTEAIYQPSSALSDVMNRLAEDRDFARQTAARAGENLLVGWRALSPQERRAAARYAAALLQDR